MSNPTSDRAERARRLTQRMNQTFRAERGFSAGILVYSFLAIPFWANTEMAYAIRITGALLAVVTVPPAWLGVQIGRWSTTMTAAALLFVCQVAWLGYQLVQGYSGVGPSILRDGLVIVALGAVAVLVLGHSRIVGSAQASILVSLSVLGLFAVAYVQGRRPTGSPATELGLPTATEAGDVFYAENHAPLEPHEMTQIEWSYSISYGDSDLEYRYLPNAAIKTYYPSKLEGSRLDREPDTEALDLRTWRLSENEGALARMVAPEHRTGPLHVDIRSVTPGKPWCVDLTSLAVVEPDKPYVAMIRMRSDRPRETIVVIDSFEKRSMKARAALTKYSCTLASDWEEVCVPFRAPRDVDRVLMHLQIGSEIGAVDVANVTVSRARESNERLDMRAWRWTTFPAAPCRIIDAWIDRTAVEVRAAGREPTSARLHQSGLAVKSGQVYTIEFKAKAAAPARLWVEIGHGSAPWKPISEQDWCDVSTEWGRYQAELRPRVTSDDACLDFLLGKVQGNLEIADVTIVPSGASAAHEDRIVYRLSPWRYSMLHRMNGRGYRDRDHTLDRPDGVFRIAFLGDSLTFAQGVHVADRCSTLIEKALNERGGGSPRFEAINFGVCGYSTWQERRCYELDAREYSPQLVIVLMHPNDVRSANEDKEFAEKEQEKTSNGLLALPGRLWDSATGGPNYEVCAEELVKLAERCRADGAQLAVFPFRTDDNAPWNGLKSAVEPALEKIAVPYRDLGMDILKHRTWQQLVVHSLDFHPNETAHKLAADAIVDFLISNHLVPIGDAKAATRATSP